MYDVYTLFSKKDGKLYIGSASDLRVRWLKHQNGFIKATKYRRPLKLLYYEAFLLEHDAKQRELFLKGGNGHRELKILLKTTLRVVNYRFRF